MASTGDGSVKQAFGVTEEKPAGIIKETSKPRQGLTTARKSRKKRVKPSLLGGGIDGLAETLG